MASEQQGRYLEFHVAVMGSRGKLTEDRVMAIADSVGLDVQRLRRDMEDPAIENYLDETIRLARVLGIRGTPAFVGITYLTPITKTHAPAPNMSRRTVHRPYVRHARQYL